MPRSLLLLIAIAPTLSCFNDCDRQNCDSFSRPASTNIGQGIAGVVSVQSEQVADGCPICALSEAGLEVWRTPAALHESGAGCQLAGTPAEVSFTAIGHFDHTLDPGEYLVCVSERHTRHCIAVMVAAGKVSTLNVKHQPGPSMVAVLDPGSPDFRSDAFDCAP
jgi:hypothetical protein